MSTDNKSDGAQVAKDLDDAHRDADPSRERSGDDEGEDEGGAAKEGNEDHLKEDQKTPKN